AHRDRITAHPLPSYSPDYNPIEYLWKKTKQRATHNKYFQEFLALTVAVDKALAYFATHPDTVLGLFGRYCEESGLELKKTATPKRAGTGWRLPRGFRKSGIAATTSMSGRGCALIRLHRWRGVWLRCGMPGTAKPHLEHHPLSRLGVCHAIPMRKLKAAPG